MGSYIFKETQRFNQPILWVILLSCHIPFHIWGIQEFMSEISKGYDFYKSSTIQILIVGIILLYLLTILFLQLKLETRIDAYAISYRYSPFINQWRKISQNEIQSVEVIKYSPWTIGGWGIRYSWNGWAYNVRGNKGIRIKKKNGKQLLIGTQQVMQAKDAIDNLMRQEREIDYGQ